jgi:hypothetical protein
MATHRQNGGRSESDDLTRFSTHDNSSRDNGNNSEHKSTLFEKKEAITTELAPYKSSDLEENRSEDYNTPPETAEDIITEVLHAEDDPSLNPWTFRVWFLGV